MATTLKVRDSNLYQNGRIIDFGDGEQLLIRDTLEVKQDQTDNYITPKTDDELRLLSYNAYKDVVANSDHYWWLLADRNNVFNPLEPNMIVGDGELAPISDLEIVLPNILRQQPELK